MELLAVDAAGVARPASPDGPEHGNVDLLLDGAHNAAGAAALASALDELAANLSPGRPTLLFGALSDKEVDRMVSALASSRALRSARVIATTVPDTSRALAADAVTAAWHRVTGMGSAAGRRSGSEVRIEVESIAAVDQALARALQLGREHGGPVVVAGSLYLVGHVRGKLMPDPPLPPAT